MAAPPFLGGPFLSGNLPKVWNAASGQLLAKLEGPHGDRVKRSGTMRSRVKVECSIRTFQNRLLAGWAFQEFDTSEQIILRA
jgi:hypothetical protein